MLSNPNIDEAAPSPLLHSRRAILARTFRRAAALPLAALLGPALAACGDETDEPTRTAAAPSSPATSVDASTTTPEPTLTVVAISATPTTATTPNSTTASTQPPLDLPALALYRGDQQRSGRFDVAALQTQPSLLWERELGASSPPLIVGDILLIGTASGRLLLLDAFSGDERQTITLGAPVIAAPAVADGHIFVGTDDGGLLALDATAGSELWRAPAAGIIWGAPLVVNETVYFGADSGFFALDAATGAGLFTIPTDDGRVYSPSAYVDGALYTAFGDRLLALDATSGEVTWERAAELDWNRLAVDARSVFCGAEEGFFYALDRLSGEERWRSAPAGAFWSAPALTDELVVVGNLDGRIFAFERANGAPAWEFQGEDWATADPVIAGDVVYVGVGNHEGRAGERPLYALDLATGELLWSFMTGGLIHASVAVDEARVYVVTTDGVLYALG